MKRDIHFHYDQLRLHEKQFVDDQINIIFKDAKYAGWPKTALSIPLDGDDTCERFANSFALWIIDSRKD